MILLGHDRSEEPFVDILMNSAVDAGVDPRHAIKILNPCQWWTVTKERTYERRRYATKLQQIDLELARNKSELANMPELKELASKRKTYVKLKSEMTKLYAQRKDLDIELDDLNTTEIQTNNAIEAANKRHVDGSDYREVQDLEDEAATLAKRLGRRSSTPARMSSSPIRRRSTARPVRRQSSPSSRRA